MAISWLRHKLLRDRAKESEYATLAYIARCQPIITPAVRKKRVTGAVHKLDPTLADTSESGTSREWQD